MRSRSLDKEEVAGHQTTRLHDLMLPVFDHLGLRGQELRECFDCPFRLHLLHEGKAGVEQDHDHDGERDGHDPRDSRKRSGADRQQRERMCQLVRKLTWPAPSAATPQLIRPELNESPLRLM